MNAAVQSGFYWRGQAYRRKGDMDRAIDDFSRAIAQAPQTERAAYYARAQLFVTKGDYARAIADFDKLLWFKPDDKSIQQQRQAAVAMQTELAKVHETQPAPAASPKAAAVAPAPPASAPPVVATPSPTPSNQLIAQVSQLGKQGKYADAVALLNQALEANPGDETALRLRSAYLLITNRFAESRADADAVLRLKPNDSNMLAVRALAFAGLGQLDQGLADANRAVGINSNGALGYIARGTIYLIKGKMQDALADLDSAISLNPKEGSAFSQRGKIYVALHQYDKALVDFDQALTLSPTNDGARAERGLTLLLKGDNAEGMVDIKNVLDRNPSNQIAALGQGLAMLVSGQTDRALLALNQVVGKNSDYENLARILRARALLIKKDTAGALADVNIAISARPDDPVALLTRSLIWLATHDLNKSLDDLDKAIARHEAVENYFVRAKIYEAQNKFDKATDDYRRVTQLPAVTVFDVLAQAEARQKVQQLSKKVPCGNSASSTAGTCL